MSHFDFLSNGMAGLTTEVNLDIDRVKFDSYEISRIDETTILSYTEKEEKSVMFCFHEITENPKFRVYLSLGTLYRHFGETERDDPYYPISFSPLKKSFDPLFRVDEIKKVEDCSNKSNHHTKKRKNLGNGLIFRYQSFSFTICSCCIVDCIVHFSFFTNTL
jgi:hypothetical protein